MKTNKKTLWLLGAAFLVVFVASLLSGSLLDKATGSGTMSEILVSISNHLTLTRISILVELVTSVGIVALAAFLYRVFHGQYPIVALVALGWWLAEAILLAASKIGAFALIPLSLEYVQAGAPDSSFLLTLGDFFYHGLDRQGWTLHMLFFCLGGILWYTQFFRSRAVPRVLSAWGVVSVSLVLINTLLKLYDRSFDLIMPMLAPYLLFEGLIGPWLIVKSVREGSKAG